MTEQELRDLIRIFDNDPTILLYIFRHYWKPFLYVNRAVIEKSGYCKKELLSRLCPGDMVHPRYRDKIYENFKKRIKGEILPYAYEVPVVDRNSRMKWIYVGYTRVLYKGDWAIVALGMEITKEKESRRLLESLIEALPHGLAVIDRELNVIVGNSLVGRGDKCYRLLLGKDRPCAKCIAKLTFCDGIPRTIERTGALPSGSHHEICSYPIRDWEGNVDKVALFIRDITDSKTKERINMEIEKARTIALIADTVAHQISGRIEEVKEKIESAAEGAPNAQTKNTLKEAVSECEHIKAMLSSILTFRELGKPSLSPVNLIDAVESVLSDVSLPERIKVKRSYPDKILPVKADERHIKHAIKSIIENAVESIHGKGEIEVILENLEDKVKLIFKDTGSGIPPQNLSRIFDISYSAKLKSAGVGLALVQSVVKQHGGEVKVESAYPNKGTTVTITLPALKEKTETEPVVVISDSKEISEPIMSYFRIKGIPSLCFNPEKAKEIIIEFLTSTPTKAVIMDASPHNYASIFQLAEEIRGVFKGPLVLVKDPGIRFPSHIFSTVETKPFQLRRILESIKGTTFSPSRP